MSPSQSRQGILPPASSPRSKTTSPLKTPPSKAIHLLSFRPYGQTQALPHPSDPLQDAVEQTVPLSISVRKQSKHEHYKMDPFECRVRFTSLIINLNATTTSAVKAAQYALKYRDMDEDLHSCIIEQLERQQTNQNTRANILYFLEVLCDHSAPTAQNHPDYIRMMQRDILRIVDAVAPPDVSGAANIKIVRKVLSNLSNKNYLLQQTVDEIEELLKERDTGANEDIPSSPVDIEMSEDLGQNQSQNPNASADKRDPYKDSLSRPNRNDRLPPQKLDKKQIEQRIEEDRERHKRLRESIWAIPTASGSHVKGVVGDGMGTVDAEFDRLWEETSELGEDDFELYREEAEERGRCAKLWQDEFEGRE